MCEKGERVTYFSLILLVETQLMILILVMRCLNGKLPDLTIINKFLIAVFALNIQGSGFAMTSSFDLVVNYCGIWRYFLRYCGIC